MENKESLKWYQKPTGIIIVLIFFFPVGLYLMWKNEIWTKTIRIVISIFFGLLLINSASKTNDVKEDLSSSTSSSTQSSNPCIDMESYNQGVKEGRTQRGILTDCDTYYPYEGWANNKDCWCKGFNEGKNN